MKKLLSLLFFIVTAQAFSQVVTLDAFRREYQYCFKDSATCYKIYKKATNSTANDMLSNAYRGAITTAMANHSKNKMEKLSLFNSGKKLLEQSISTDTTNIETRFLRFTVQTNCPKALGYHKQINSDKAFILKNYSSVTNMAVKKMITSFAIQSKDLSETEKQKLK